MENAELYNSNSNFQTIHAMELIPKLVSGMDWNRKSTHSILDFGCGTGTVTKKILIPTIQDESPSSTTNEILGLDLSEPMIELASKLHAAPGCNFIAADIVSPDFQFPNELQHFDKIFSFYALHWIQDQR